MFYNTAEVRFLMTTYKSNNFYLRWQQAAKAQQKAKSVDLRRQLLLPAVVVGVSLAAFGLVKGLTLYTDGQTEAITAWCTDPANTEPYQQSLSDQAQTRQYQSQQMAAEDRTALLGTYPNLQPAVFDKIQAVGGSDITVVFNSYDAASGQLAFDAQSANVIDIPAYVRAMQNTGLFASVSYTGYGYGDTGTYAINLACILAAPEQEAAQ